jgi:hypothetical protein
MAREGDPVRLILVAAMLTIAVAPLRSADAADGATTPVAEALDWYSVWWASSPNVPADQVCRGELKESLYAFRCDPLAVVFGVVVDESGVCRIVSIVPSISADDGLRVQALPHLFARRDRRPTQPRVCGELPLRDGSFEVTIAPRSRSVNKTLTLRARDAALRYNVQNGDRGCVLRFPNVKSRDPFCHVYEDCQGVVHAVWEFRITDGEVADFPHWSYTPSRGGLPVGIEWRENRADLWFDVSPPEERNQARR